MHDRFKLVARAVLFATLASILASCASVGGNRPEAYLHSFRVLPTQTGPVPEFQITLQVINPDREPLRLNGLFYSLELEGKRVLNGVTNQLPMIDGYSEALVDVNARVNLFDGIRLISDLIAQPREKFEYTLKVRMESDRRPRTLRVHHRGELSLNGSHDIGH